jgi:cytidyltransferase-like protein
MPFDRFPTTSAHGRFQPFHNGHLEYVRAAKERCDFLWIGITKYDIDEAALSPLGTERERPENIKPGERWEQAIRKGVRSSAVVLVCLSKSINRVGYLQKEISFVLDRAAEQPPDAIFIIPIRLEECPMREELQQYQWVDLFNEQGYPRLTKSLLAMGLGKKDTPKTLRQVGVLEGHTDQVQAIATAGDRLVISASCDKTLKVWDLETRSEVRSLKGHLLWVNGVAVTQDGKLAISASEDGTIRAWDVQTGKELCCAEEHPFSQLSVSRDMLSRKGISGSVFGVALSEDGKLAVSVSGDPQLRVWKLKLDGKTPTVREKTTLAGHTRGVRAVVLSGDGQIAISASDDRTLRIWNVARGVTLQVIEGHGDRVLAVALRADAKLAVSASADKSLRVWDLDSGRQKVILEGHSDEVCGIALSPDGCLAASTSYDRTLKLWDVETGRELATFSAPYSLLCCAVSNNGKTVLCGGLGKPVHVLRFE